MKLLYLILGGTQIFVVLGALPAGIIYLSDTSGAGMGHSVEMLADSPLKNFLIPGLFLVIIHGIGNLTGALLSFRRMPRAGLAGLLLGMILCFWIIIQVYWIGLSSFLQPLLFLIGASETAIGWLILRKTKKDNS